jgi:hypothetical protein
MDWFFNQWVYGCSIPTYRVAWKAEPADHGQYQVRLRVRQEDVPADFLAYVPVRIETAGKQIVRARVKVTGASSEVIVPVLLSAEPTTLEFNDLDGVLAEVRTEAW